MSKLEQKRKVCGDDAFDMTAIELCHMIMENESPGSGDLMIEAMVEELQKIRKKPEPHCCEAQSSDECSGVKQYIGTKLVQARPAWRVTTKKGHKFYYAKNEKILEKGVREDGYEVFYPDGYQSWSPKEVFEDAYRETTGMNFGLAIEAAKIGKKIARKGWNGKSQYVELANCISYMNANGKTVNADHCAIGNKALAFVGTSGVQMGWLASQADMLADDWYIVG